MIFTIWQKLNLAPRPPRPLTETAPQPQDTYSTTISVYDSGIVRYQLSLTFHPSRAAAEAAGREGVQWFDFFEPAPGSDKYIAWNVQPIFK